jgi:hypothetical protein
LIEGDAYRYLVNLSKHRRRLLEKTIEALAAHPFQTPIFTDQSADGDRLDVVESNGHLITYHVDHATRRILVTEIQSLL